MKQKMMMIVVAVGLISSQVNGWAAEDPKVAAKEAKLKAVSGQLASGDAQQIDAALKTINEAFVEEPRRAPELLEKWSAALIMSKRYDDTAAIALTSAINSVGTLQYLENALRLRARSQLNAGKTEEALQTVKSLYNACSLKGTSSAIDQVAQALTQAHKEDPEIGKKFKLQQLAAATTNSTEAIAKEPSMLAGIKVNRQPYQEAIDKLLKQDTITVRSLFALGTLYLMADQPDRAEELFKQAYDAGERLDLAQAIEGIACAYRAQDGNVRRANAYILEQRSK